MQLFLVLLLVGTTVGCGKRKSAKPRDNQEPHIVCPADIIQHADAGQVNAWISWPEPIVTDNFDGTNIKAYPCGRGPNERYSGTNYITYRAKDRAGHTAKCTFKVHVYVLKCDAPNRIANGYYQFYPSNDFRYGGTATYGCYSGYQRNGHRILQCRVSETWSGSAPTCEKIRCSSEVLTGKIDHGKVSCSDQNRYQSKCTYTCDDGYRIQEGQARVRVCSHRRQWLGRQPSCVDIEAPEIHRCPVSKIIYTDKGKSTASVTWFELYATDNSRETIQVKSQGGEKDAQYSVGTHTITFTAVDSAGNKAKPCRYTFSVRRLTCHTIYPTPGLVVTCEEGFGYGASCQMSCEGSLLLVGKSEVECRTEGWAHYVRWSWGSEQPSCRGEVCPALGPPANGALACDNWIHGRYCLMFCNDQYVVPIERERVAQSIFACGDDGNWHNNHFLWTRVPDCSIPRESRGYTARMKLHFFSGDCCDTNVVHEIQETFIAYVNGSKYKGLCDRYEGECHMDNVRVTCGQDQCTQSKKKRSLDNFDLYLEGTLVFIFTRSGDKSSEEQYKMATNAMNELAQNLADDNTTLSLNESLEIQSWNLYKTEVECEDGLKPTPYGFGCVGCESGSYFDLDVDECVNCPVGSYNNGSQITECLNCPPHTTTPTNGSKSVDDCIDYCPPGKYSTYGTVPCTPCPVGSYTDVNQATLCTHCPAGMTTASEGSSSLEQCHGYSISIVPSVNGSFGLVENITYSGTELFISLKALVPSSISQKPLLSIYNEAEEVFSLTLSDSMLLSVGSMEINDSSMLLIVDNWNSFLFHLSLGELPILNSVINDKEFDSKVELHLEQFSSLRIIFGSQNGTNDSYEITDVNIWSAVTEYDLMIATNSCSSSHYGNIVSWHEVPLLFQLNDAFFNVPAICDVSDQCVTSPCGDSTCVDGVDSFTCVCHDGYTGELCEVDIDDCAFHACENEATCVDAQDDYICVCTAGFTGQFCEQQIVDGGWGEWSEWSVCSKSCNNGTQSRSRSCDQPLPGPDGAECSGESVEQHVCNMQNCHTCSILREPENGYVLCEYNETTDMNTCTQHCHEGYQFSFETLEYYVCGYDTGFVWNNATHLQCTEIEAPSSVSVEHSITFDMACSDRNIEALEETFTAKLEGMSCILSGLCSLSRIDIMGDGCPVHVPGMDGIRVQLVLNVVLPESTVTGVDVLSALFGQYTEVTDTVAMLYHFIENGTFTVTTEGIEYQVTNQSLAPLITCPSSGYVWIDYYCVPCQIGTYEEDYTCYECPIGTYQDETGRDSCVKCPTGLTTQSVGSWGIHQCDVPPLEEDICASFHMDNTDTEVGWLCGHTEVKVTRQYLTADNFTDVFPHVSVLKSPSEDSQVLIECTDSQIECVTRIDEQSLDYVNVYIVVGSVPASAVTCLKTVTVTYKGLSSNGVVFLVFMILISLCIFNTVTIGLMIRWRSRKKIAPSKHERTPSESTLQSMKRYLL